MKIMTALQYGCFRYHKGTDFQANHNSLVCLNSSLQLFQIPQRYRFSSKSQLLLIQINLRLSCFRYHKGTDFQANHNDEVSQAYQSGVVLDTTKVQIFKQITTNIVWLISRLWLFQIPQRYRFSSKSQQSAASNAASPCCFRYHKGTDFQANHNRRGMTNISLLVVLDTTKVQIFKQITTGSSLSIYERSCFRYHKGTDFQANHNLSTQKLTNVYRCFRYHKGTDFQANHNRTMKRMPVLIVVLDTTKVQIFKQITTTLVIFFFCHRLFQIPQRYRFSSKSQLTDVKLDDTYCCFRYHKGTDFQANHNILTVFPFFLSVVLDTTKVQIFKQITTT